MRFGGSGAEGAEGVAATVGASVGGGLLVCFEAVSFEEGQKRSQPAAPTPRAAPSIRRRRAVERMVMERTFIEYRRQGLPLRFSRIEVDGLNLPLVEIGRILGGNVQRIALLDRPHRAF